MRENLIFDANVLGTRDEVIPLATVIQPIEILSPILWLFRLCFFFPVLLTYLPESQTSTDVPSRREEASFYHQQIKFATSILPKMITGEFR